MSQHFCLYLDKIKYWVDRVVAVLCILILMIMTGLVTYQVIVRYIFNSPSTVSEVLARFLFIWLILLAGAYVFGLREHMAIPYLKEKCSEKVQILLDMVIEVVIVLFAIPIMIIGGYSSAMRQMSQTATSINMPMGVIYSIIPISGALILFYFIYNELKLWHRLRHTMHAKQTVE